MFSLVTLWAHALFQAEAPVVRTAAWYAKLWPTFVDAIALVRRELWSAGHFLMFEAQCEMIKLPRSRFEGLTDAVGYAA